MKRERRGSERSEKSDRKPRDRKERLKGQKLKKAAKNEKEKGKKSRRREERMVDDTQSELSYGQPDTDLSKSKATKRAFSCEFIASLHRIDHHSVCVSDVLLMQLESPIAKG